MQNWWRKTEDEKSPNKQGGERERERECVCVCVRERWVVLKHWQGMKLKVI